MARASPVVVWRVEKLADDARQAGVTALKFELCNSPTLAVANPFTGSA